MALPIDAEIQYSCELINVGKGIIPTLTQDNLFYTIKPNPVIGLQDVIQNNGVLTQSNSIILNGSEASLFIYGSNETNPSSKPVIYIDGTLPTDSLSSLLIGHADSNIITLRGFDWFSDKTLFTDTVFSKGLEYADDYKANFTNNSLVTKLYTDNKIATEIGNIPPVTGDETKIINGTNTTVTGNGTIATPYQINVPTPDGSETKVTQGSGITVSGTGTTASPYVITANTTVKATSVVLNTWNFDKQHSLATGIPSGSTILSATAAMICTTPNNGFVANDTTTTGVPELNDSGGRADQGIGIEYNNVNPTVVRVLVNNEITVMSAWTADGATNNEFAISDSSQWGVKVTILYI